MYCSVKPTVSISRKMDAPRSFSFLFSINASRYSQRGRPTSKCTGCTLHFHQHCPASTAKSIYLPTLLAPPLSRYLKCESHCFPSKAIFPSLTLVRDIVARHEDHDHSGGWFTAVTNSQRDLSHLLAAPPDLFRLCPSKCMNTALSVPRLKKSKKISQATLLISDLSSDADVDISIGGRELQWSWIMRKRIRPPVMTGNGSLTVIKRLPITNLYFVVPSFLNEPHRNKSRR